MAALLPASQSQASPKRALTGNHLGCVTSHRSTVGMTRRRMALVQPVQTRQRVLRLAEERRRFQRVRVNLLGRYMLSNRNEYPCQVANMSPGGMAVIAPVSGQEGERVIAYIDHLGRLEGKIVRLYQN